MVAELPWLRVDASAPNAAAQLHDSIANAAAEGTLAPGEKLPSVRALAEVCHVAPNTAAKAIKSLAAAGIVETDGRRGTRIKPWGEVERSLQEALAHAARLALSSGVGADASLAMFEAALRTEAASSRSTV
ncbi:GntR family transcriptional regulator [Dermabacter hominis 1368]|uniref:GntR family transcriptional regulator n=1 Tax=Dermabacter hominis 1368 TaxID=1450519 RepID=A0ABR4SKQ5_9MICO|nr:GntR family transcriptional regulator [Dermabacter hominis 1368]